MVTFEQLAERYLAGDLNDQNLKLVTYHVYKTEGAPTAYGFAREWDEKVGVEPYNKIMSFIAEFIEADKAPKVNEKAVLESELMRANLAREKALKQAEQEALAHNLQSSRGIDLPKNLTVEKPAKLFVEKETPGFKHVGGELLKPSFFENKTALLLIALVVIVAGFLMIKKD